VRSVVAAGETVAQEIEWAGTHTGPLPGPSGPIPASGKPIQVTGTLWYTIREGKAQSIRHHMDVLSLLQQVGALPQP
jgi:predicted ester cyclase